jgi:hypothetical protein
MADGYALSRRSLLRNGAVIALLSAVPVSLAQKATAAPRADLTRSTFTPLLGRTLLMVGGGTAVKVVLSEINDLVPVNRAGDEDRFSLVFAAPKGEARSQGIKEFRHPDIGKMSIFVAPTDRGTQAVRFEAVINRL